MLRFEDGGDAAEEYVAVCVRVFQDRERERERELEIEFHYTSNFNYVRLKTDRLQRSWFKYQLS